MSRDWRGGKGDANRIKDRKKWDDGWANIDWGKKPVRKTTSKKSDKTSDNSNENNSNENKSNPVN